MEAGVYPELTTVQDFRAIQGVKHHCIPPQECSGLPAVFEFVKISGKGATYMALVRPDYAGEASWSVDDIPYQALAYDRIRNDQRLFHIVASASFIEITSDLYTKNLVEIGRAHV